MIKIVVAAVLCALVSACGGGAGNDAKLRFANLTTDSAALSLYTGSDERIANINPEQGARPNDESCSLAVDIHGILYLTSRQ